MTAKQLSICNAAALIVTIFINYLSNTGIVNNNTMKDVSDRYQNHFTPAGYAFSIWGLIYLALLAFVIYGLAGTFKKKSTDTGFVTQIDWWFVISCMANCFWIFAWLYDYTGLSVLIMIILLVALFRIVIVTNVKRERSTFKKSLFVWLPFSLYSGWITVALIANIAAYLIKIKWNGFGITEVNWTIIMICAAVIINLFMTWSRRMWEYALVGVWALAAIAINNQSSSTPVVQTAFIATGILLVSCILHALKPQKVVHDK
jgi:hypothetical protein